MAAGRASILQGPRPWLACSAGTACMHCGPLLRPAPTCPAPLHPPSRPRSQPGAPLHPCPRWLRAQLRSGRDRWERKGAASLPGGAGPCSTTTSRVVSAAVVLCAGASLPTASLSARAHSRRPPAPLLPPALAPRLQAPAARRSEASLARRTRGTFIPTQARLVQHSPGKPVLLHSGQPPQC